MKRLLKKIAAYALSIGIALAISALSAIITMGKMNIMDSLIKPPLSPPSWLFPIVWTILYILMGVSAAMIYKKREFKREGDSALLVYSLSLGINFLWSIIFFIMQKYLMAFIWLMLLLGSIIITIYKYKRISTTAALLQIPYAIWVAYAGYLTFGIWILNR